MTSGPASPISRRTLLRTGAGAGLLPLLPRIAFATPAAPGTITVGTPVDIVNFDPYNQSVNSLLLLKTVNAWLLEYDERLRPNPSALESYEIGPGNTSVTLKIRPDVVFHTGKTMTVDDVIYGFERAADPKRGFNLFAAVSSLIDKVERVDDRQLKLTLKQPTATTLITDMLVHQPVVDSSRNSAEGLGGAPASAGPYRVVEWRQGEGLTLEAFPQWFKGKPKTQKVAFRFFTSPAAAVSALASGAVDVLAYPQPRDAARLKPSFDILSGYPGAATMLLRVSTKTPPFDNKIVRQALQRAINRDRIVQSVLFEFGGQAYLPWGPNSPIQDASVRERVSHNLAAAKALLEKAPGIRTGEAMVSGSDPTSLLVMQIIQSDLASIGFDLKIDQQEAASFNSRLVAGQFGVALGQVGGGQLSIPRIVQNSLMRTANNPLWPEGNPPKAYVEGITTLIGATDPAVQQVAYKQLRDVLIDESWAIATYDVPTLFASKKDLKGVARDHQNALVLADAGF
jgi:peptide/nickel transport system substrate-binding protein